jgi:ferredoxin
VKNLFERGGSVKRNIINISAEKCTGCGLCIPNCPEGAIQIIDGKARLVSDLFCDGLGACLGHCPEGAIVIEKREAEEYDENKVMENIVKQGKNTILAHLKHLKDHGETKLLSLAIAYLKERNIQNPLEEESMETKEPCGCPGSKSMNFTKAKKQETAETASQSSELTHWPVQLHLISPMAPQYQGKDVLLSADCVAYSLGNFHSGYLKGKALAIACPKLDENQEVYAEKITALIDQAKINTLTVMIMQVPCCGGLLHLAEQAASRASRKIPVKSIVVGLQGDILKEEWL